jgi:hypothetical protein
MEWRTANALWWFQCGWSDECYSSDNATAARPGARVLVDGGEGGVLLADDAAPAGAGAGVVVDGGKDYVLDLGRDGGESVH